MKKTFLYRAVLLILVSVLCTGLFGCEKKRAANEIAADIATQYGKYGAEAKDSISELFKEFDSVDKDSAQRWRKVMDVWTSPELGDPLHYDVLPDGLPDTNEFCIVVLGFKLNDDGTMQDELIQRLTVALNSANKYKNALIVCTGGGTAKENENATEAGEMAKWLIEQGIAKDRIIVEDQSKTTAQNAMFTYDKLTKDHSEVKKLAIVSSDYHIKTGELLFKAQAIFKAEKAGEEKWEVVSNAAWKAPSGALNTMFQAGALIELSGDKETAFDIYFDNYTIHELPGQSDQKDK